MEQVKVEREEQEAERWIGMVEDGQHYVSLVLYVYRIPANAVQNSI